MGVRSWPKHDRGSLRRCRPVCLRGQLHFRARVGCLRRLGPASDRLCHAPAVRGSDRRHERITGMQQAASQVVPPECTRNLLTRCHVVSSTISSGLGLKCTVPHHSLLAPQALNNLVVSSPRQLVDGQAILTAQRSLSPKIPRSTATLCHYATPRIPMYYALDHYIPCGGDQGTRCFATHVEVSRDRVDGFSSQRANLGAPEHSKLPPRPHPLFFFPHCLPQQGLVIVTVQGLLCGLATGEEWPCSRENRAHARALRRTSLRNRRCTCLLPLRLTAHSAPHTARSFCSN